MHELPIINSIHTIVVKHALANQVRKVVVVHLAVGALSDLEEDFMQQYFDHVSKGSVAEGAKLVIERIPAVMRCSDCGASYEINLRDDRKLNCPKCGGEKCTLISGREYHIKNMEVL
jgi:hydrogenase nickel incorporation protein HypA/HybF